MVGRLFQNVDEICVLYLSLYIDRSALLQIDRSIDLIDRRLFQNVDEISLAIYRLICSATYRSRLCCTCACSI